MADVYIKQGDSVPILRRQLLDVNGDPVDLFAGGGTVATVEFFMRRIHGETVIDGLDCTVEQEHNADELEDGEEMGWVTVPLADTLAGGYHGEFQVTYSGGVIETHPNVGYLSIAVDADIPPAEDS